MRIVLSGPPSIGKTTQGKKMAESLGIPHISSGALIRHRAAHGDPRAQHLAEIVSDGSLAPSNDIVNMVLERIALPDCRKGFILDGFPRKIIEAQALLAVEKIDAFIALRARDSVLLSRVLERGRQSNMLRLDDDPEAFPRRIHIYKEQTAGVSAVMAAAGVDVHNIDAEGEANEVWDAIRRLLRAPETPGSELQVALAF